VIVADAEDERGVAEAAEKIVAVGAHDVVFVELGGADRAARRGKLEAAIAAVEVIDQAIGRLAEIVEARGGALVLVGTHGAAEEMLDAEGKATGSHTTNPVPFVLANFTAEPKARLASAGELRDVAPTLLDVLEISKPEGMTGTSLKR